MLALVGHRDRRRGRVPADRRPPVRRPRRRCSSACSSRSVCYYVAFITRGTLSGNGRFGAYGLMHGSEGTVRIVACLALFVIGVKSAGLYGHRARGAAAVRGRDLAAGPAATSCCAGPEAPYSELSGALAWLLLGSRARAAALVRQRVRREPARDVRAKRTSPRTSSPAVHRPRSRCCCSRRCRPRCSRSSPAWRARESTTTSASACAGWSPSWSGCA